MVYIISITSYDFLGNSLGIPDGFPDGSGFLVNTDKITYSVSNRKVNSKKSMALVDRGANGIVAGAD